MYYVRYHLAKTTTFIIGIFFKAWIIYLIYLYVVKYYRYMDRLLVLHIVTQYFILHEVLLIYLQQS